MALCFCPLAAGDLYVAYQVKLCNQDLRLQGEVIEVLFVQRFGARQFYPERVAVCAINPEFIMQVWPGRKARTANITDRLSLLDAAACFQSATVLGEVRIEGAVAGAMLNNNRIAIAAFFATVEPPFLPRWTILPLPVALMGVPREAA